MSEYVELNQSKVFTEVWDTLEKLGWRSAGGSKDMVIFKKPYSKLFFNIYGDLVIRKWELCNEDDE